MDIVPGTEGYEKNIKLFVETSQRMSFFEVCKAFVRFLPEASARLLDVGCGAGQNAGSLAELGHEVIAVDPMSEFLAAARTKYSSQRIKWVRGSLPGLDCLQGLKPFDFILIDGVMHHLDPGAQMATIERIADLLEPSGKCAISLRNGPPGMGTYVHPTNCQLTTEHAEALGLKCIFRLERQHSIFKSKKHVFWDRIVLSKP